MMTGIPARTPNEKFTETQWQSIYQTGDNILDLQIQSDVPEPATLALLGLGFAGLGFGRRKQA